MLQRIVAHILIKREKGQSLVEVALFFPIFLIILAGVVEVSHLGITQNRVSNAARASTRYASQGGEDAGIPIVALNSVTQTLELGTDVWDIWAIRGQLDNNGNCCATDTWQFTHVYGISQTEAFTSVNELTIKQDVEKELQLGDAPGAADLRFVGTYLIHDVKSILGIQAIPSLLGYNSVRGLNVMRLYGTDFDTTGGCDGFPIGIQQGIRSLNPPGTGSGNDYPATNQFHSTSVKPSYNQFYRNVPDKGIDEAQEGYIFKIPYGPTGSNTFSWLQWNTGITDINPASSLNTSLTWPGNAFDYANHPGDTGAPATPLYTHVVRGYVNPNDTSDLKMNKNDWVMFRSSGADNSLAMTNINEHITKGRYLRVVVWAGTPGSSALQISDFAVFRLQGHNLAPSSGSPWLLAEFIRRDSSCGQS